MVLILAATIGKMIYDEVKDHKGKKNGTHKRSKSDPSQSRRLSMDKPLPSTPLQTSNIEPSTALQTNNTDPSPTSLYEVSPVEGVYEMDVAPPPYQATSPVIPERSPLRVKVGNDVVPWSPDDIVRPSIEEVRASDVRRKPSPQVFELE
ncbi:uncharacterized protein LY89DRAFT_738397 [Mollisia scopiformis]|uniref:Uncharacterized protein n=1 Tax=Mollisia scopiformis TaxID=149040 RepID=A0A194WY59_MOLSC|nr:uncharacterized protein LY89DRAFT_738397 [Mollisia scopiformis]KUJ12624.1 hypothetical protein LY89DRAFT_738397 [Mollisia scopiformis]